MFQPCTLTILDIVWPLYKNNGMPLKQVSALLNHKGVDVILRHYIREDKKKISSMKDKFELLDVA